MSRHRHQEAIKSVATNDFLNEVSNILCTILADFQLVSSYLHSSDFSYFPLTKERLYYSIILSNIIHIISLSALRPHRTRHELLTHTQNL